MQYSCGWSSDEGEESDDLKTPSPADSKVQVASDGDNYTALVRELHYATRGGDVDAVRRLIGQSRLHVDAALDDKEHVVLTPLWIAARHGHVALVRFLLSRGARVDVADMMHRDTPLVIASYFGHVHVVRALLQYGADVRRKGEGKRTALEWAQQERRGAVVALLKPLLELPRRASMVALSYRRRHHRHVHTPPAQPQRRRQSLPLIWPGDRDCPCRCRWMRLPSKGQPIYLTPHAVINTLKSMVALDPRLHHFNHNADSPGMESFVKSIADKLWFSEQALVCGVVLLHRFMRQSVRLRFATILDLALVAIRLAAKMTDDDAQHNNNARYAFAGGVRLSEMNRFEIGFLHALDYNVCVSPEEFVQSYADLHAAQSGPPPSRWEHCDPGDAKSS
jgi:hypothetical protein